MPSILVKDIDTRQTIHSGWYERLADIWEPVSIRMVVDLPAPFGPRKPKKQPRGTVRLSPSTAALLP